MRGFVEFLNCWIFQGEVLDPFEEYFVKINIDCKNPEDFWNKGLIFYAYKVPCFLEQDFAINMFKLGKLV